MSTKKFSCPSTTLMESTFAYLQEIYSHVEFLRYDGKWLFVAYVA